MDFDRYIVLNSSTPVGFTSWVFLVALALKVCSTATGLWMKMKKTESAKTDAFTKVWWLSKLSALLLCLTAALLCHYAGDTPAAVAFIALFVAAIIIVAMRAVRLKTNSATTQ